MFGGMDVGVSGPWRLRCIDERFRDSVGPIIGSTFPYRLHGRVCGARVRPVHQRGAELTSWRALLSILSRTCLSAGIW